MKKFNCWDSCEHFDGNVVIMKWVLIIFSIQMYTIKTSSLIVFLLHFECVQFEDCGHSCYNWTNNHLLIEIHYKQWFSHWFFFRSPIVFYYSLMLLWSVGLRIKEPTFKNVESIIFIKIFSALCYRWMGFVYSYW